MSNKIKKIEGKKLKSFHLLDCMNIIFRHKFVIFSIFLLISFVGILISISLSKTYSASVKFHIFSDAKNVSSENLQKNESDVIKSTHILRQVVTELNLVEYFSEHKIPTLKENIFKRLNLNEKEMNYWFSGDFVNKKPKKELLAEKKLTIEEIKENEILNAINRLYSMIYVSSTTNSATLTITVNSLGDSTIVAKIANVLMNIYEKNRLSERTSFLNREISAIEKKITIQENANKEILCKIADFRQLNTSEIFHLNRLIDVNPGEIEQKKIAINAVNIEMVLAKKMLANINAMNDTELEESFCTNGENTFDCLKLKNELNEAIINYELVKFDALDPENEKNVKRAKLRMDELRKQLDARLIGIKKKYLLQYELLELKTTELQKELDELIETNIGEKSKKIIQFNKIIHQLSESEKNLIVLKEKLNKVQLNQELPTSGLGIYNLAIEPANENAPNMLKGIIASIFSAIFVSLGLAFLIEFLSTSIRDIEQIEKETNQQVLVSIPVDFPLLLQTNNVKKKFLETFRLLWTNLVFLKKKIAPNSQTIIVTSARESEGKSSIIANLAYIAAKAGEKILVLDANLHRPTQHKIAGIKNSKIGLIDFLEKNAEINDCITASSNIENLKYIFAGENYKKNSGLINSEKIKQLLEEIKTQFDYIFIDSPPIIDINYTATLIDAADLTIIVIKYNYINKKTLKRAIKIVNNCNGKIAGIVLNKTKVRRFGKFHSSQFNNY